MRKMLTALAALSALGVTPAMAATPSHMSQKATGTIKSINQTKDELTLQNGKTFIVAKSVDLKKTTPGEKVTVTYTQSGKAMDATQINKAP